MLIYWISGVIKLRVSFKELSKENLLYFKCEDLGLV